jgi:phage shock protein A
MHEDTRKRVTRLQAKADLAAQRGDTDLSEQLRAEAQQYAARLTDLEAATARAIDTADRVKEVARRAEERFRNTPSDPDALRAQIEADIAEARARHGLALVLVFALLVNVLVALLRRRRHG